MADFFIRRPIVAMVISIFMVILGLVSLSRLPIAEYPTISPTLITVKANYRGAAAQAVMDSVATPIESQVNGVDKMLYLQSYSANDGSMNLNVLFDVGADPDIMQVNTQNRVSLASPQLPDAVRREGVVVNRSSPDLLMVLGLFSPGASYDALFLSNYANINLVDAIKRVPGVGDVKNFTAQDYSMRIWIDPDRLASFGLTMDDVAAAIREQNAQSPAGSVGAEPAPEGTAFQYNVRAPGLLQTPGEFEQIIIRSNPDGSRVTVRDVARVELGAQTYQMRARQNRAPAAALGVYLAPGANALATAAAVNAVLEQQKALFPPDMDSEVTLDSTLPIKASMENIIHTLVEAALLVLLVVYLFLQSFRATLIPMLTVPIALIGTFAVFPLLGFSVNTLTMFGLVLAIGIVVDDAIVVVEAVQHHLERGKSPREATLQAMKEVSGPVIAIALVLCAVFLPVAFMGGLTGGLYQQFAITVAVSVVLSAINALTLSPALCAMLLKRPQPMRGPVGAFFRGFNTTFDRITNSYTGVVGLLARKAFRSMLLLVAAVGLTLLLSKAVPGGFVPDEDKGYLFVHVELPESASLQRTDEAVKIAEKIVAETHGVRSFLAVAGTNVLTGLNASNAAVIFVGLDDWHHREAKGLSAAAIAAEWNKKLFALPGAKAFSFGPPPLPGYGNVSGFSVQIQDKSGGSLENLHQIVSQFLAELSKRPEIALARTSFRIDTPQVKLDLDRDKARALGVPIDSVFQTLQSGLSGLYVNDFVRFGRVFKVFLQAAPEFTAVPESIGKFHVRNAGGQMVPLGAIADVGKVSGANFAMRSTRPLRHPSARNT
ncbi:MAG: efflux RND transporter permease subunit, partial [Verrucomicrobiia bacterium]